ncbi:unnamed protein product [Trichogramma brassicae]|uniref:Uncharacterized protein n=1 Tax=Trichogramma brassicae TaxID=86971 RepID=A0A6H5II47_9HYME|nr:unnamed protein product [Trichogramma brassicae]
MDELEERLSRTHQQKTIKRLYSETFCPRMITRMVKQTAREGVSAIRRSPYRCEPYVRVWERAAVDEATARGNSHKSLSPFYTSARVSLPHCIADLATEQSSQIKQGDAVDDIPVPPANIMPPDSEDMTASTSQANEPDVDDNSTEDCQNKCNAMQIHL